MKVLLIIPPTSLDSSYGKLKNFSNPQPSIGLAYIAAILEKNGVIPKILDCYAVQMDLTEIIEQVRSFLPEVIGISCLSSSYDSVKEISLAVRKHFPDIHIVGGNLHASLFADEMLSGQIVDFVLHREGDYALAELCHALEHNTPLEQIQGLSFRRNGEIVETDERPLIRDLDALPFPQWQLFPPDAYHTDPRTELIPGQIERQILATRGCPNACTFCSSRTTKSLGSHYRTRSAVNVCDEIEYMMEQYGSRAFSFVDLAFPLVKKHAMSIFDEIIKRRLHKKIKWCTECRVKPLDQETVMGMKESGCVRVNFGIESGNDDVLRSLKKNFGVNDVRRAISLVHTAGLEVDGMFMMGLPGETEDQIEDTIRLAVSVPLRYAIFNLFVPYPGCELYEILSQDNKIHFSQWSDFTSYGGFSGTDPIYVPDTISKEKLLALQKAAMRRFYFKPRFIWGELVRFRPSKIMDYLSGLYAMIRA